MMYAHPFARGRRQARPARFAAALRLLRAGGAPAFAPPPAPRAPTPQEPRERLASARAGASPRRPGGAAAAPARPLTTAPAGPAASPVANGGAAAVASNGAAAGGATAERRATDCASELASRLRCCSAHDAAAPRASQAAPWPRGRDVGALGDGWVRLQQQVEELSAAALAALGLPLPRGRQAGGGGAGAARCPWTPSTEALEATPGYTEARTAAWREAAGASHLHFALAALHGAPAALARACRRGDTDELLAAAAAAWGAWRDEFGQGEGAHSVTVDLWGGGSPRGGALAAGGGAPTAGGGWQSQDSPAAARGALIAQAVAAAAAAPGGERSAEAAGETQAAAAAARAGAAAAVARHALAVEALRVLTWYIWMLGAI
jgi:hypothetical protein